MRRAARLLAHAALLLTATLTPAACTKQTLIPDEELAGAPTYAAIHAELFVPSCTFSSCHTGSNPAAALNLLAANACETMKSAPSCLFGARHLVVPGAPDDSFLLDKLLGRNLHERPDGDCAGKGGNLRMPFGAAPMSPGRIEQVRTWIATGAPCGDRAPMTTDASVPGDAATNGLIAVSAAATALRSGTRTDVTVTLARAAPLDGAVLEVTVSDASALGAPATVFVPAGKAQVAFPVAGKRPRRPTTLTVRADGGSTVTTQLTVVGLYLAEVVARPAVLPDGLQWIKLRNDGATALNLAAYSFGAGVNSLAESRAALVGILQPGACALFGGPLSQPDNGSPTFDASIDFQPDLPNNLEVAGRPAGFGLFDVPAGQLTAGVLPIDAVGYGPDAPNPLEGTDGQPLDIVTDEPPLGGSAVRTGAATWELQPSPRPDACMAVTATGP